MTYDEDEILPLPSDRNSSGRSLGSEEMELLQEAIDSGFLFSVGGQMAPQFEKEVADLYGVSHARAVPSGTAAVHTALAALDIAPGDEVVTSPITDMGAITPILYQGGLPVFADVDPETLNVTADTLRSCMSDRTEAIIVTHLFGNPCDMDPILKLAEEHDVPIIEDAAQAYLATYRGQLAGTMGDLATFSLQQGKHMTCGEGGIVITDHDELARRARVWGDKGWNYADEDPDHEFSGLNYRISELQAAVALAQLRKLEDMTAQRVRMADRLRDRVSEIPGIRPVPTTPGAEQTYWKFVLLVDREELGAGPDELSPELKDLGVWNKPRYIRSPAFMCKNLQERITFGDTRWPYSAFDHAPEVERIEDYSGCREGLAQVLVLPWTEKYEERHVDYIADSLERVTRSLGSQAVATGVSR